MPQPEIENPFLIPREARTETRTFRMTKTEEKAVEAIAKREGVEVVDLIREGLALVIEKRQRAKDRK